MIHIYVHIYVCICLLYISVGIYTHTYKQLEDQQQTAEQMCDTEAAGEQQLQSQQSHNSICRVQSEAGLYHPRGTAVWKQRDRLGVRDLRLLPIAEAFPLALVFLKNMEFSNSAKKIP